VSAIAESSTLRAAGENELANIFWLGPAHVVNFVAAIAADAYDPRKQEVQNGKLKKSRTNDG
jgi:hypothetical protein